MPYAKLKIQQGFYTEDTAVDSANRWVDGDHIRFVSDYPEKIGGWNSLSLSRFKGVCRSLKTWNTLQNDKFIALGTNLKAYIYYEGGFYDITPYRGGGYTSNPFTTTNGSNSINVFFVNHGLTISDLIYITNAQPIGGITLQGTYNIASIVDANNFTITAGSAATSTATGGGSMVEYAIYYSLTNPFTTTAGSDIVVVSQTAHGCSEGDFVNYINSSPVGGLVMNGTYQVAQILNDNQFSIQVGGPAPASATGGGTVNFLYEINTGSIDALEGLGWGSGQWGVGTWGTARQNQSVLDFPRVWTQDVWEADLILCPRDGGIYYWNANINNFSANRAVHITNAPARSKGVFVWPDTSIVVALGCTDITGVYDPMHIRWTTSGDYNVWKPGTGSTSGFYTLGDGNEIIGACKMRGQVLIATDTTLYSMFDDGTTFAFKSLGDSRVLSPNCMVEVNGIVYYMGEDQFYVYDGNLNVLPCSVRRHIFDNLNFAQSFKVYGAINSSFNEIWWFYPSNKTNSDGMPNTENDSYVVYNYQKNIWYYGTMDRTAFLDIGEVIRNPIGVDPNGYLYAHESGFNANGNPLECFIQSGDMRIDERNKFAYIKNIVPDMASINGNVTVTLTTRRYPASPAISHDYTITPTTDVIGTRAKGGQVGIRYYSNEIDGTFGAGDLEILVVPTGAK